MTVACEGRWPHTLPVRMTRREAISQRQLFGVAQAYGGGEHVVVGDRHAAVGLAIGAGSLLVLQSLAADAVAFGLRHGGQIDQP